MGGVWEEIEPLQRVQRIAGIEQESAAFCLGVQWHPENFWRTGEFAPLFDAFVNAARSRMTVADT